MRRRLIEALTYPRLFVLKNIGLEDCPHDELFDRSSDQCHNCRLKQECHWLSCVDSFAGFAQKPDYTIHASLQFGIKLIDARNQQLRHDSSDCACESCTWTRDAQQLTRESQANHPRRRHQYIAN